VKIEISSYFKLWPNLVPNFINVWILVILINCY